LQDKDRSYWCVTGSLVGDAGNSRLMGRVMSYAAARELLGSRLTFERFAALRLQLPELFGLGALKANDV
jgi:hypothetical protein